MNPKTVWLRLTGLILDLVLNACSLHLGKKPLVFGLTIHAEEIPRGLWESHGVLEWPTLDMRQVVVVFQSLLTP